MMLITRPKNLTLGIVVVLFISVSLGSLGSLIGSLGSRGWWWWWCSARWLHVLS